MQGRVPEYLGGPLSMLKGPHIGVHGGPTVSGNYPHPTATTYAGNPGSSSTTMAKIAPQSQFIQQNAPYNPSMTISNPAGTVFQHLQPPIMSSLGSFPRQPTDMDVQAGLSSPFQTPAQGKSDFKQHQQLPEVIPSAAKPPRVPLAVRESCPNNMTPARWAAFLDFCLKNNIAKSTPSHNQRMAISKKEGLEPRSNKRMDIEHEVPQPRSNKRMAIENEAPQRRSINLKRPQDPPDWTEEDEEAWRKQGRHHKQRRLRS
ncbi:MAG: hypothetical protein Q9168_003684 [Polycauliona sp. 1 TL-2023]